MVAVSVVIITKDQAEVRTACIDKAKLVTDDIVIVDNGIINCEHGDITTSGCKVYRKKWDGYGANKNKGIDAAKYDWILSIDADEVPDDDLITAMHRLDYINTNVVYDIQFRTYFGDQLIRFGRWGNDHHIRLFNRKMVRWLETPVHETLSLRPNIRVKKIGGYIHHYSVKDAVEYEAKSDLYAKLSAVKYLNSGKKAGLVKRYLSPIFGFFKNYIFHLGFLDGRAGWEIARITVKNTRHKYELLNQMQGLKQKRQMYNDSFVIEY